MMHKGFDFSQMGGFPLNQQRLEYMQDAYNGISTALAGLIGDNTIVSGCVVNGTNVSDGWVVIGGELLPFVGGASGATVIVRETRTPLIFKDGTQKEVQFSRVATFGAGVGSVNWSDMKRAKTLRAISNLPTEYTSDPNVSDSEILATSKIVNGIYKSFFMRRIDIPYSTQGRNSGSIAISIDSAGYACFAAFEASDITKYQFSLSATGSNVSMDYSYETTVSRPSNVTSISVYILFVKK